MKVKATLYALVIVLLLQICNTFSFADTTAQTNNKIVVGIAWRSDTDSEFYTNIYASLLEAGAEPVLLNQVIDRNLEYVDGQIAPVGINADGYLTTSYAEIVKHNDYTGTNIPEVLQGIDAVVFTGGEDISPTLYANPVDWHHIEEERDYNATRDVSDYLLMSYCIDNDIPSMGFCRGLQMLAVISGASMIQDIPTYYQANGLGEYNFQHRNNKTSPDAYRDYAPHDVTIRTTESIIYDIFGAETISAAPSWHHQAVESVEGTNLIVTASTETNGYDVIEALERTDKSMIIGFQFHPEAAIAKNLSHCENAGSYMDPAEAILVFEYLIDYCESIALDPAA